MRAQIFFLLIFSILFSSPAFSKIYTYIDSKGRLTYTSDPSCLPDGHEHKTAPNSSIERLESVDQQATGDQDARVEGLSKRFELAKAELEEKIEKLSEVPANEYDQAIQAVLSLKLEILDINEEIVELTPKSYEENEIRLERFYAWSDQIDILLGSSGQTEEAQAGKPAPVVPSLSFESTSRRDYPFSSPRKENNKTLTIPTASTNSW